MLRLLPEAPGHIPARELLLDRCFGPNRRRKTCEALRHGRRPAAGLAFSLLDGPGLKGPGLKGPGLKGQRLIGTLRFWHITAGSAGPVLLLGPVAVAPERQGAGLGALLVRHGLAEAERLGHAAVLLVGDAPYYRRFGFRRELTQGLAMPGPVEAARFLGLELLPGALEGACGAVTAGDVMATVPDAADFTALSVPLLTEQFSIQTMSPRASAGHL